ncbi:MAG TPA: STAS domain-containing protein [Planctomycetota bacterium]|jgi:anti-sigma B factor antagonist
MRADSAIEELCIERTMLPDRDVLVLTLIGSVSAKTFDILESEISDVLRQKHFNIVIDLANVNYVSSAGAGVLMNALAQLRENRGNMVLAAAAPDVREILDLLKLSEVVPMVADLESALKLFQPSFGVFNAALHPEL